VCVVAPSFAVPSNALSALKTLYDWS